MHDDIDHPRRDNLLPLHHRNSIQEICVGIRCLVARARCKDVHGIIDEIFWMILVPAFTLGDEILSKTLVKSGPYN
ncbi:hypothetical protein VNO77_02470 [Canavalia gladiata]|uniref:Uncharacterized protein n=1 Tax=Canavalia gladiata TaxID=3824 RepID=A0AAN9MT07_CANGL